MYPQTCIYKTGKFILLFVQLYIMSLFSSLLEGSPIEFDFENVKL